MTETTHDAKQANDNTAQKWYTTLPAILGAVTALVGAVGGILAIVMPKDSVDPAPAATVLPSGANASGWVDYPYAHCDQGAGPAAMAITTKSALVICQAGPGDYYYRGVRLHDDAGIELAGVVRSSGGFDVRNPTDGTRYELRPTGLTITTPDGAVFAEPVVRWWAR